MPALVVFESMFGNTEAIAKAVADGLTARMAVDIVEVGVAPAVLSDDVELLVVGGPTHAFGMSRPGTRQKAAEQTQ
ncbi:MAG TPA: flavodoxin domain-containing protein [Acidimicrobiia bacterium]|nr:flavodoxin domain-containing protein [Acidimicrobiia bacterium]